MKKKWKFYIKLYPLLMFIVMAFISMGYALVDGTNLVVTGTSFAKMQEGIFMTSVNYIDDNNADIMESRINSAAGTILNSTIKLSETDINSYITYRITLYNNYDYDCFFEEAIFDSNFYDNENIIFEINSNLISGMKIPSKTYTTFDIMFRYKNDIIPSKEISILNSYINLNFSSIAIVKETSSSDTTAFRSSTYKEKIKTITFEDDINVPETAIESWDIGVSRTKDVMAYVVKNTSDENYYDLYIQSDTQLYANENMSYWFSNFLAVESINNLELMNTEETTNMSSMFYKLGYNSESLQLDITSLNTQNVTDMNYMFALMGHKDESFTLNVSFLDTQNVTNMNRMFLETGFNSKELNLDVSNFDTSNVTDMAYMFYATGYNTTELSLNLSNFNTENVTNMSYMFHSFGHNSDTIELIFGDFDSSKVTSMEAMFYRTGRSSETFELDITPLETSSVINMSSMFYETGYKSTKFDLDLKNFNTTNVTNMSAMFYYTGYTSTEFTLDLTSFNTANVTTMNSMFNNTGYSNPNFTLDVSSFNTANVTDMGYMFYKTGTRSTKIELNIKNFNTSNVTNMTNMFMNCGYNNTSFTLDVSNFDTSKVITMGSMFSGTGYNSTKLELNVSNFDTSKVTNMNSMFAGAGYKSTLLQLDVSKFDTSKVTNMGSMFLSVGKSNPDFTLNVSNFDTSKVTNMQNMFREAGFSSTSFTLDVSNFDTSKVTNMSAMFYYTGYNNPNFTLTLGDFNTKSVTNFNSMFASCGMNSTILNTSITIRNPNATYSGMFSSAATKTGSKIVVNYTSDTYDYVDLLIATKSATSNVVKGGLIIDIGEELVFGSEKFNVIGYDDTSVTMLAQKNLGINYRQNATANAVIFAENSGWEYTPGPKEVDIQIWSPNTATYINEYVSYIKTYVSEPVTGDLISLSQLADLDCIIPENYTWSGSQTCAESKYKSWLVNGQYFWTKSAYPGNERMLWMFYFNGYLTNTDISKGHGIRPTITISIDEYMKL